MNGRLPESNSSGTPPSRSGRSVPPRLFGLSFNDGKPPVSVSRESASPWKNFRPAGSKAVLGNEIAEWTVPCIVHRLQHPLAMSLFGHGWSPSLYHNDRWLSASAVIVEVNQIDAHGMRAPIMPEMFHALILPQSGALPGNFAYVKGRSIFIVFVFAAPITVDEQQATDSRGIGFYATIARGAAALVRKSFENIGLTITTNRADLTDEEYARYVSMLQGMNNPCEPGEVDGFHASEGLLVVPKCRLYQTFPLPAEEDINEAFLVVSERLHDPFELAKSAAQHFVHPACHDPDRLCWYFFHWLNVAIGEGMAYLSSPQGGMPGIEGTSPSLFGWWPSADSPGNFEPRGTMVGWVDAGRRRLHLLPEQSYRVVSQACCAAAMTLPFSEKTVGAHLAAKGWLESHREHDHNAAKGTVVVDGVKRRLRAYRLKLASWLEQCRQEASLQEGTDQAVGDAKDIGANGATLNARNSDEYRGDRGRRTASTKGIGTESGPPGQVA